MNIEVIDERLVKVELSEDKPAMTKYELIEKMIEYDWVDDEDLYDYWLDFGERYF